MPRRAPKNSNQCVYKEGNRRCVRDGTGDPPVCAPHQIAYAHHAQRATSRKQPGDAIADLIDSVISGRKVSKKKIERAWNDVGQILNNAAPASGPFRPPPGFQPPPNWTPPPPPGGWWPGQQQQPPPVDPGIAEAKRAFAAAKRVMGFADSQKITADDVRDRKKQLARKYHPDMPGGSASKMAEINNAADVLLGGA